MSEDVIFQSWFQSKLSDLLGFPAGEEMMNYILAFESAREIREHLFSLLDPSDPSTKSFLDEFFARWRPPQQVSAQDAQLYKKEEVAKVHSPDVRKKTTNKSKNSPQSIFVNERNKGIPKGSPEPKFMAESKNHNPSKLLNSMLADDGSKMDVDKEMEGSRRTPPPSKMIVDTRGAEFLDKNALMPCEKKGESPFKAKHLKYVPLYSADGKVKSDVVQLDGRHPCKCLAQKHMLINNCAECGRIVCAQEGAGPCIFCGNLVCSREDMEAIERDSKKSKKLHEKLLAQTYEEDKEEDASLQKAIAHKERLLEYDKNCTRRTKVLDDEADYFSDNRWLSKKDRDTLAKREKELREKRHTSRLDKKFTLDFAGRQVVEEERADDYMYDPEDAVVQSVMNPGTRENPNPDMFANENPLLDPRLNVPPPQYTSSDSSVTDSLKAQHKYITECMEKTVPRVQDQELQQVTDKGVCMSMHQPWASLLVHGIKKLEGRSWYTPHRGRLWIASTVKEADKDMIRYTEEQYRCLYPNEDLVFPDVYPAGALLGCVNVVDCATNEEYFAKNPDVGEENDSAYLFVCENAVPLKIKFQMKGKHKTYKLEKHVHDAAKKNLLAGRNL